MQEALRMLEWYVDAGVDEALQDSPRNYFTQGPGGGTQGSGVRDQGSEINNVKSSPRQNVLSLNTPADPRPPTPEPRLQPLHHAPAAAIAEARRAADSATTRDELEEAVRNFEGCALKRTATKTVFSDGNPQAKLMLIGEAPGAQEDMQGIPFCGASGMLLDKMFAAIGYDRTSFYITNTLFWRPPGNRTPTTEELAICQPFVEKHVALMDPELIVLVGGTAARVILNTETGITRLRGKSYSYRTPYKDKDYPVAVIYHPSYLLRSPAHKKVTWQDLLAIKAKMNAQ